MTKGSGERSIRVGRSANNSNLIAGDFNKITAKQKVTPPAADTVDILAEIVALRAALSSTASDDAVKIRNAVDEAEDEARRPKPNKDEVATALSRAINYAQKAEGFAEEANKLIPHIIKVAGWLGVAGTAVLASFGLST